MDFIFIKSSKAGKEDFGSVYARVRTGKANVKTVTGFTIRQLEWEKYRSLQYTSSALMSSIGIKYGQFAQVLARIKAAFEADDFDPKKAKSVIESVKPILNKHGFYVAQQCLEAKNPGLINVVTTFEHVGGGSLEFFTCVPLGKMDPQGGMGAFTYGRRYGLLSALCLAAEDDDAADASDNGKVVDAVLKENSPVAAKPAVSFVAAKK